MKCKKCNLSLIEEEYTTHVCMKAKGFEIKEDILWLSDGVTKYPLKMSSIVEDMRTGKLKLYQPNFDSKKNNRKFDRTLKQYSYKVLVPYYTVW